MPTITSFKDVVGPAKGVAPRGVNIDLADLRALAHHINSTPSKTKRKAFTVNTFEGGEKRQELFRQASGFIAIDLEGPKTSPLPEGSIEAILSSLDEKGLGYVWYHTHSHLSPPETKGERARVIFSCSPTPNSPEEHRALVRVVMAEFPDGCVDRGCVDPARGFFYPPEEHPATYIPGRQLVWDPSVAVASVANPKDRPEVPESLCCTEEDLEEFTEVFRSAITLADGNRNNPALWFLGALHCAGADEDTCKHYYERAFHGHPEHLSQFQPRYTSTSTKDPGTLKIWGDFNQAGLSPDPHDQNGLMGLLGKLDGDPLKAKLTPRPAVTIPIPVTPTPNEFPGPKAQYSILPNDEPDTIVKGFVDEFFGPNHFRIRSDVAYYYDSTTWREVQRDVLIGRLRGYQQRVEFLTDKGSKRVYQKRATSQLRDLEQALFTPSESEIFIPEAETFEDPEYIALQNGLLHLPTLELRPFTPTIRTLNSLPVSYDPEDASTPQLNAFFDSCDFDAEKRRAWLDGVSYLLFGSSEVYQKAVLMVGPPRAGKGVSSALVAALVGEQNTTPISIHAFGETFGLQSAINRKLMIVNDAEFPRGSFGGVMAGTLKQVIAGEVVAVNRKHQKVWRGALGKLLVCSNVAPRVDGGDRALAGRWHIVEFTRSHLDREDLTVAQRLKGELQQIFNRLLLNWYEVQQAGRLYQPESAEDYRQDTLQSSDVVEGFIAERLVKTDLPSDYLARSSMWDEFRVWQEENATHAQRIGKMAFLQQLKTSGFRVEKNVGPKHLHAFVGVKLA
jgi:hypothetical protein